MHHVIIGAGPAGIIAGETLRKLDPHSAITVIGDESEPPYSRMALSYFLIDKINEMGTYLRKGADYYAVKRIDVKIDKVIRVDPAKKQVQFASGKEIPYDKLLIATGSHPRVPPNLPGIDLPGIYPCWTLEDARHIASQAMPGAKVVLMGAGFIGCIILEALAKRGVKLTVVERGDGLVPRIMNSTAGALIKQWCNRKGVTVHTSIDVTAIEGTQNGRRFNVVLGDGHVLPADLVITATGVGPNVQFLLGVLRGLIQSKIRLKSWKDKLKADPTRIMEAYIANTHALGFNGDRFNAEFYYENKT
jgi:NADPH-dependent 2,4-dienoyl-CoA reductase/sulfur reductase-like enzyme